MTVTVAIVGRPNVGKSTLFNRLVGRRQALVHDTPGVTRDRREGTARLGDLRFRLTDTAGLEDARPGSLARRMADQSLAAAAEADAALFVIDARAGVTPADRAFADALRRAAKTVVVVANKCEGGRGEAGLIEAFALGFGEPVGVSAEHGEGLAELFAALAPVVARAAAGGEAGGMDDDAPAERATDAPELQLAIVGQPNVGKSTLINRLIGRERMLTGPEAGITRDAVTVAWIWKGETVHLIDTAGLRRRARVTDALEEMSAADSLRAVRFAHVVVLVIDATQGLARQDFAIGRLVADEGRALVVAANMWDRIRDRERAGRLREIADRLADSLPQVKGVPVVPISALGGTGLGRLMEAVKRQRRRWRAEIKTGPLNRWLQTAIERHPPPRAERGAVRIRYATQTASRPPTFALFANRKEVADGYLRYLANEMREAFDLAGTPIRIRVRTGKNPFAPEG